VEAGHRHRPPRDHKSGQQELRALDRHEKQQQRGEHFGRYGYLAYADRTLMKQDDQATATPEPTATDHAPNSTGTSSMITMPIDLGAYWAQPAALSREQS
jgi:hypothetical protein